MMKGFILTNFVSIVEQTNLKHLIHKQYLGFVLI